MESLTKIFFGILDKNKVKKNKNFNVGFWGSDEHFIKLNEPIDWEHGVFQYFKNNRDEFWSTVTGFFKKNKVEDFGEFKNELIKVHPEFDKVFDLFDLIALSGGDLFDVKDDFDYGNTIVEGEEDSEFINLENYSRIDLEEDNSIWIFEISRYQDVKYEIENNNLNLLYESSDELNLYKRFIFSVAFKKN
jgi:hypothetical protein